MKKVMAICLASFLIGSVCTGTVVAASTSQTTDTGMSASSPSKANSEGKENDNSPGLGETMRIYWNKFIDVFTGPPSSDSH